MPDSTDIDDELEITAVVAPAGPLITALARAVSPFKGGCPNTPPCEHPGYAHDIEDDDDPLPTCGAYNEVAACPCGDAPPGFRRVPGQRVWQPGEKVPAGAWAWNMDGAVWTHGAEWVNHLPAPLIEVEPVWDDEGPPATASQPPASQPPASRPPGQPADWLPPGRYQLTFDRIGRYRDVSPLRNVPATAAVDLAVAAYDYARPRLYSERVLVTIDLQAMTGVINVGPSGQPVGSFSIERVDLPASAPASGQPEEAAGVQAT